MIAVLPWIFILALLYLGVRWFEKANLYFPEKQLYGSPADYGLAYEEVRLPTADGMQLGAWYVPPAVPGAKVLILSHGNGGNRGYRLPKIALFRGLGYGVLSYDYRGYGDSSGSPSEKGTYLDAQAAYDWLARERKIAPEAIVSCGESLGSAVALDLALKRSVAGLILESAFTSTEDVGRVHFPFLPVRLMVSFRYDNRAKIKSLRAPLLVVHSPSDEIVPFRMGRELFSLASEPKTFLEISGTHNDGYQMSEKIYKTGVRKFMESLR